MWSTTIRLLTLVEQGSPTFPDAGCGSMASRRSDREASEALRDEITPKSGEAEDPWGFAAARPKRIDSPASAPEDAADPFASFAPRPTDSAPPDTAESNDGDEGAMAGLRKRALPLALALAAVFIIGCISEVVAASQFVHLLGPRGLIIIYPLGGLGLVAVALIQMKWIDRVRRDKALVAVSLVYALAFIIGLSLMASPVTNVVGTGFVCLLADQLNFLLPLIVWAIVGDLFNAGEGRKIYPWITNWRYGAQMIGLAVPSLAPFLLVPLGVPLTWLLIVCPVGLLAIAYFVPRSLRGRNIGKGSGQTESTLASVRSAWNVVGGVKAFKAMFITSTLAYIAGMSLEGSFLTSADAKLTSEAQLQVLYGMTLTAVFVICWVLQRYVVTSLMERLDIPGSLAVMPIAVVVGAAILIVGLGFGILPIVVVGIVAWRVPWWSIDDVARRAALALVPDERRTRVSYILDLVPFAIGLIVAGGVIAIATALHMPILAPILAVPIGVAAVASARTMIRTWPDALLSHHLKRRKRLGGMNN